MSSLVNELVHAVPSGRMQEVQCLVLSGARRYTLSSLLVDGAISRFCACWWSNTGPTLTRKTDGAIVL